MDVAHRVKRALKDIKELEVDVDYESGRIDRSYKIDNKKFEQRLDFRYSVSIEEASREIALKIKNFLDSGGKLIDLEKPIHYNINWMLHLVDMENKLKQMGGSVF